MTRVLVCGGREFADARLMNEVLNREHASRAFSVLIYGMARGADDLAKMWATARGIARLGFPADWERHGRRAGPMRNARMIESGRPDLVIAFPGGAGTADMVRRAWEHRIPVILA